VVRPHITRERLLFSTVYSDYYLSLALRLARHGIETWLPDLRGHGHSAGQRGHTRS
jgi:alpha-beta hydrolase superfamily lysophospholipase